MPYGDQGAPTALADLGLAPADAPDAESFRSMDTNRDGPWTPSANFSAKQWADVMRKLADGIEAGRVNPSHLEIYTTLKPDSIVEHELSIRYVFDPHTPP